MLLCWGYWLSCFCKNKCCLCECLCQCIFFRDKVVLEVMEKLRVFVLIGVGIFVELGICIFCVVDGLWEEYWVEDVVMLEGFDCDFELV